MSPNSVASNSLSCSSAMTSCTTLASCKTLCIFPKFCFKPSKVFSLSHNKPTLVYKIMEPAEDVVIVGAGLAGLATAIGLHRQGVRIVVLESSEHLRAAGFALTIWSNAWKALDALGVADSLREQHVRLERLVKHSASSGATTATMTLRSEEREMRRVRRDVVLQTLAEQLPNDAIRYSSKVVSIEQGGNLVVLQLADGSVLRTKVLIGCDGVNSVVAKWLGLKNPCFSGRSATRGFAEYPHGHGFSNDFLQFCGEGFRVGLLPCDDKSLYWFFTWPSSSKDKEIGDDATKMRKFVIGKLKHASVPEELIRVIEESDMSGVVSSPLRLRWPCELLWGNISKGNVCVAGDAFHPMTPDLGQGGCAALEDGVVLARCLGKALLGGEPTGEEVKDEQIRIKIALEKYAKERRWRGFDLITTGYLIGLVEESENAVISYLRDKWLSGILSRVLIKRTYFDCGKL